ncbi:MAG TPA: Ni/Fe-hydrogenase cytochrome b subunit [Thermoanaerobaculia bacterium]
MSAEPHAQRIPLAPRRSHPNGRPAPVGGKLLTGPYKILLALAATGFLLIAWRFAVGLGAATALSDGYPWGLWIVFDVVTGTALACGGYAVAILVYILNKGRYHPLVRPAVLTSVLGYSIAGLSIVVDLGRPWHLWKVPLFFWEWNLNSALLEVALCIEAYVLVAFLELAPAFLERWREGGPTKLQRLAKRALPFLDRALIWILAFGILLPTMHQSSLGTMMLLTGPRLHPLWNTPLVPLFFLINCLALGYAAVVLESTLSSRAFGRKPEIKMLGALERIAVSTSLLFAALRLGDVAIRGHLGLLVQPDLYAALFWSEIVLLGLAPFAGLAGRSRSYDPGRLFRGAMLLGLGGALYRFDTYLVAFNPGPGWHYFPSVPETLITAGLVAFEVALYIAVVKRFPILAGFTPASAPAR